MSQTDLDSATLVRMLRDRLHQQTELCVKAEDENAKLRDLIGIMRTCIKHACLCDFCPLFTAEDMNELRCIADMDSRMRELGMEVPDGD